MMLQSCINHATFLLYTNYKPLLVVCKKFSIIFVVIITSLLQKVKPVLIFAQNLALSGKRAYNNFPQTRQGIDTFVLKK